MQMKDQPFRLQPDPCGPTRVTRATFNLVETEFRQTSLIMSRAFISLSLPLPSHPTHTQNESHFSARISNPSMFKPLQAMMRTPHSTTDDRHIIDIKMRDSTSHQSQTSHFFPFYDRSSHTDKFLVDFVAAIS